MVRDAGPAVRLGCRMQRLPPVITSPFSTSTHRLCRWACRKPGSTTAALRFLPALLLPPGFCPLSYCAIPARGWRCGRCAAGAAGSGRLLCCDSGRGAAWELRLGRSESGVREFWWAAVPWGQDIAASVPTMQELPPSVCPAWAAVLRLGAGPGLPPPLSPGTVGLGHGIGDFTIWVDWGRKRAAGRQCTSRGRRAASSRPAGFKFQTGSSSSSPPSCCSSSSSSRSMPSPAAGCTSHTSASRVTGLYAANVPLAREPCSHHRRGGTHRRAGGF